MPKANSYEFDDNLQDGDKVLGTDTTGSITKNYSLSQIKEYLVSSGDFNKENIKVESVSDNTNAVATKLYLFTTGESNKTLTLPSSLLLDDIIGFSKRDSGSGWLVIDGNCRC